MYKSNQHFRNFFNCQINNIMNSYRFYWKVNSVSCIALLGNKLATCINVIPVYHRCIAKQTIVYS